MAKLAAVLKDEIVRLARKEMRAETGTLKKASAQHRTEVAALKRRIAELEKQLKQFTRSSRPAAAPANGAKVRFSAKGLRAQRTRLELSAAKLGALLGVSGQTIYSWEAGTTRPGQDQLPGIVALRKMGKREVAARLAAPQ